MGAATARKIMGRNTQPPFGDVRAAWNDDGGAANKGAINQMPQHPPLYYQAMATVLRVERWVSRSRSC